MKNLILGIVLGVLVFIFAYQNFEIINIDFFYWRFTIPSALLVILVFAIGLFLGWIFANFKHHKKMGKLEAEIKK